MNTTPTSAAPRFLAWLGSDIFQEKYAERYAAAYLEFRTELPEDLRARDELAWDIFRASVDAWAARRLSAFLPGRKSERSSLLPRPEKRDPVTGFRRGQRGGQLSVNTAAEEELRQVPGIGASSARKIVEGRAHRGPFTSLEQLVVRGCLSPQALQMAREHLAIAAQVPGETDTSRRSDFVTCVRIRHALQGREGDVDLASVAISELEAAVSSSIADGYWERSRRDPAMLSIDEGHVLYRTVLDSPTPEPTALLDAHGYLKLLKRLLPRAAAAIWIQAPSLGLLHVDHLRSVLVLLAEAAQRCVDVRVLFDEDYSPAPIESDDVAYLAARGVACRAYPFAARMHSRVFTVDHKHVVCGSHSWSAHSMFRSEEVGIYARSRRLAAQQAERFDSFWRAAGPEKVVGLDLFRFWSPEAIEALRSAGISDANRIVSVDAVEGLGPEELKTLQREVLFVIRNRLPVGIAHSLAKTGIDDLASVAELSKSELDDLLDSKSSTAESTDLAPLGPYLKDYFARTGTCRSTQNTQPTNSR